MLVATCTIQRWAIPRMASSPAHLSKPCRTTVFAPNAGLASKIRRHSPECGGVIERKSGHMQSIKGTQTEKHLLMAFAGESQARNRYTYFAGQARTEGLIQIADVFEETANQEKEHAKRFFKFLEGGSLEIQASFPAGVSGKTDDNLNAAAAGEDDEWSELYPRFGRIAREEGFEEIAK